MKNKKNISSKENPTFKYLKKLVSSARFRENEKKFWVEGKKVVKNFLMNFNKSFDITIVFSKSYLENNKKSYNQNLIVVEDVLFNELSQINSEDKIALIVKRNNKNALNAFSSHSNFNVVLLNEIQDPGNLGTAIRTCVAFGVKDIWLTKTTVDPWAPKVIRAAVGFNVFVNFKIFDVLNDALSLAESEKFKIFATILDQKYKNLYSINFNKYKKKLFVFGNEGKGLPLNFLKRKNLLKFKITHENFVESLNVASAVAISLAEVNRQTKY